MDEELDIDELLAKAKQIRSMSRDELESCRGDVLDALAWLDDNEPKKHSGDDYDLWCDCHEDLEDMADELADRLL